MEDSLTSFMRTDMLGRRVIVVDTAGDLTQHLPKAAIDELIAKEKTGKKPVAFARNGKAYIIADRVRVGDERGIFLHEVGSHLGLQRMLGRERFEKLARQVVTWAASDSKGTEASLAKLAMRRVRAADTAYGQRANELVAYFVEEAVNVGIDPQTAASTSPVGRWLREVWGAFKRALVRLGVKTDTLVAQDIVDMAYGAAQLNVRELVEAPSANLEGVTELAQDPQFTEAEEATITQPEPAAEVKPRTLADLGPDYADLAGKKLSYEVMVAETGETATMTADARNIMRDLDERESLMKGIIDCLRR
jgi:hypothetical protein